MDFTTLETPIRTALFLGLAASTGTAALWSLTTSRTSGKNIEQNVAVAGALATVPAAVAAPFEGGSLMNAFVFLGIAGLIATVASLGLLMIRQRNEATEVEAEAPRQPMMNPMQPAFAAAFAAPAPASQTRVGSFESKTSVSAAPVAEREQERTILHGASHKPVARIAFVAEQSGDGTAHRLGEDTAIGRAQDATIVLHDSEASREHARIKFENGRFVLYDLGGANGTSLVRDGRRRKITTPTLLNDQDVIIAGRTKLAFLEVES